MLQRILILVFLLLATACGRYNSGLESLGTQSSFSDVTIPDDFLAPEDEPMDEPMLGEDMGEEVEVTNPITPPPVQVVLKNTFFFEDTIFSLAHDDALRWDGCVSSKASQGGYNSDSQCGRAFIHPSFANQLNEIFFQCVSEAAEEAGLFQPQRIFIRHLGSYNDRTARNSTRLSHHAYARALDIVNFNLFDNQGRQFRVSTLLRDYDDEQAVFYDQFRDCWKQAIPQSCKPGDTEANGSVGHQASKLGGNSLHNDHLHLAYPLCAGDV